MVTCFDTERGLADLELRAHRTVRRRARAAVQGRAVEQVCAGAGPKANEGLEQPLTSQPAGQSQLQTHVVLEDVHSLIGHGIFVLSWDPTQRAKHVEARLDLERRLDAERRRGTEQIALGAGRHVNARERANLALDLVGLGCQRRRSGDAHDDRECDVFHWSVPHLAPCTGTVPKLGRRGDAALNSA